MTQAEWDLMAVAFEDAQSRPEPERLGIVLRACGDNAALRAEVEALLRADAAAGSFLVSTPHGSEGTEPDAPPRLAAGRLLAGRYRIEGLLGRGGMGEVYAARDLMLEVRVALKTLRPGLAANPAMRERFKREVQLARRITHPNVCRIYDLALDASAETDDCAFLTMELLEGETLASHLRRHGPAGAAQAERWLAEMAAGLEAAHAVGVIHRDFKPGNVILHRGEGGALRVVVTDFGLAHALAAPLTDPDAASGGDGSRAPQALVGTLAYMAPEQLAGEAVSAATDVYAFGLVMYELLTGQAVFAGSGPFGGMLRRLEKREVRPSGLRPELGAVWDRRVAGCLRETPAARLAGPRAALDLGRRRPGWWRRHGVAALVAALAAVVVASGGAAWVVRDRGLLPRFTSGGSVLLVPVVNTTGDPRFDAATTVLSQALAQSARFNLLGAAQIGTALQRMGRAGNDTAWMRDPAVARQLALRAGAPLVVAAGLGPAGAGRILLTMRIEQVGNDPGAAARAWSRQWTAATAADLFPALHDAAVWVRREAGEPAAAIQQSDQALQDITTSSWSALELFERAEFPRAAEKNLDPANAEALLREALRDDPQFALAWGRLGDLLDSQGRYREGFACYKTALALIPQRRLSLREELRLRGLDRLDHGDWSGAEDAFTAMAASYPNDYLAYFYQPWMDLGQPQRALAALATARRLAPQVVAGAAHLVMDHLWLDDGAGAEAAVAALRQAGNPYPADELGGQLDFVRGDYAAADGVFARLRHWPDQYFQSHSYVIQADAWAERGEYARAIASLQEGLTADQTVGTAESQAAKHLALAYLDERLGRRDAVRSECLAALQLVDVPPYTMQIGSLLAEAGWSGDAQRALDQLGAWKGEVPVAAIASERIEGELRLQAGQAPAALALLQQAAAAGGAMAEQGYLARGYAAAGDLRQALATVAPWADHVGRTWYESQLYPPGWWADSQFAAALYSDRLGEPDAAERWRRYLSLRATADADVPDVAYARQRAGRLNVRIEN